MQKCNSCGAELPEDSRFCGECGSAQDAIATDAATAGNNSNYPPPLTPPPPPITPPPPPAEEDKNERKGDTPDALIIPISIPTLSLGNAPTPPLVQEGLGNTPIGHSAQGLGNPPISPPSQGLGNTLSPPSQGLGNTLSPPSQGLGNVPISPPAQGPTNAPISPPIQGSTNIPISSPAQGPTNAPISPPIQAPTTAPISSPVPGPQPVNPPPTTLPISHPVPGPYPVNPPVQGPTTAPIHCPPEGPGTKKHHKHPIHRRHPILEGGTKAAGSSAIKTIIIAVTAVAVVAAGGIAAATYFLSHPQPFISVTSNYRVGNVLAGANGTTLHISGQKFSRNSAITFLLDGHVAPGNPSTQSDSNGNFSTDVAITNAWSLGTHILTARDASNYSTQNGVSVTIVQPGQANTPGPDGAPPDDASFKLAITIQATDPYVGEPFASNPVLIITGHPDPEGGTVCSPNDNGQSFTQNGTTYNHGTSYTEVETATCSGTYKAGQISYIETDTSASSSDPSSGNCALNNPAVILRLTGAYAGHDTFSGTINYPYVSFVCDQQGSTWWQEALTGTWTGTMVTQ
jgi:hypothetical protein